MNNNQKKLAEALAKINFKELANTKPFSEDEYRVFKENGLTQEEISNLEDLESFSQLMDLLPADKKSIKRLSDALDAVSSVNPEANKKNLVLIAQKDPQMLVQLLALAEVAEQVNE